MAWAGVGAVAVDKFNPDGLRWRVVGGLALYAVAALAWTGYMAYTANLSPAQWAATLAEGEAASVLAQGRSLLNTIGTWGVWIVIPLGYFSLLIQNLIVHPPLPASPGSVIHTVRTAGGQEAGQAEKRSGAIPTGWPWGGTGG
jgi:hypothetical protein